MRDDVRVELRTNDRNRPILEVVDPEIRGTAQKHSVDLVVQVPAGVKVVIEDSAGELNIEGLSDGLQVQHGEGSVTIRDVKGGVKLTNSGGPTTVRDITG